MNLGINYDRINNYEKASFFLQKSMQIYIDLFGENDYWVAKAYNNIGNLYTSMSNNDKALDYYNKCVTIRLSLFGEDNLELAKTYKNIGNIYYEKKLYNKAFEFFEKSLKIHKKMIGNKHNEIAELYSFFGDIYHDKDILDTALIYYQKAICADMYNFNDTINLFHNPILEKYLELSILPKLFNIKGDILFAIASDELWLKKMQKNKKEVLENSLHNFLIFDTIFSYKRKFANKQLDKLFLGTNTLNTYQKAINVCKSIINISKDSNEINKYNELMFYFSERTKSMVLLEALSNKEAQKFAGIPDSLLKKEQKLQSSIVFLKKEIEESFEDSIKSAYLNNKLFETNRSYDSLIVNFEKNYSKYHELKYNTKTASVKEIQNLLDKETAFISYFVSENTIVRFLITNN